MLKAKTVNLSLEILKIASSFLAIKNYNNFEITKLQDAIN